MRARGRGRARLPLARGAAQGDDGQHDRGHRDHHASEDQRGRARGRPSCVSCASCTALVLLTRGRGGNSRGGRWRARAGADRCRRSWRAAGLRGHRRSANCRWARLRRHWSCRRGGRRRRRRGRWGCGGGSGGGRGSGGNGSSQSGSSGSSGGRSGRGSSGGGTGSSGSGSSRSGGGNGRDVGLRSTVYRRRGEERGLWRRWRPRYGLGGSRGGGGRR